MKRIRFIALLLIAVVCVGFINVSADSGSLQFYLSPQIMNDVTGEIVVDVKVKNFNAITESYYGEIKGVSFIFTYNKDEFTPLLDSNGELGFKVDEDTLLNNTDGLKGIVDLDKGQIDFTYLNKSDKQIVADGVICRFLMKATSVTSLWNSFDRYPLRFVQGTVVAIAYNSENSAIKVIENTEGIDTSIGGYNIAPSLIPSALNKTVKFTEGSSVCDSNGVTTEMDAIPYVSNGVLMVPVRYLAEGIGMTVEWQGDENLAAAYGEFRTLRVSLYNKTIYLNSAKYNSPELPVEINGRIYIPAETIGALYDNAKIDFDGKTVTIYIP